MLEQVHASASHPSGRAGWCRSGVLVKGAAQPLDDLAGGSARGEDLGDALLLEQDDVLAGDDAAAEHQHVVGAPLAEQLHHPGEQGHVGARVDREADGVGVLLDHRGHDLLGGLVQAGVDDLHAGVAQRPGHDLGPPVVPVQPRLGDHDPDASLRHGAAAPFAACADPGSAAGPHLGRYYPAMPNAPEAPSGGRPPVPAPDNDPPLRPGRDPGGRVAYLPPKAARARKLILRSQLGRGWIVAAALFGVVILAAGALFLARAGRPGAPWIRVAPVSSMADGAVTEVAGAAGQVVVVDRRGTLRAFLAP